MKSIIVKTLALGAVCAMAAQGAWATGTDTDENGNQPAMWYKFDGSVTNVGTVDPTSTGNTGGSYEDVGDKDGNQAYKIVTTSHNIYGQNMNNIRGSGDFTVMLRAKLSSLDNGVVWSMGTSGSGRFMALCEDGGNSVSFCLAGNSWSMADGYTTVNNTAVTKVITKTVENATLQYHVYTVSWDNTNKIWTLDVDGESSTYAGVQDNIGDFTNGNWQFGGVHGGMGSRGLTEGVGIVCDDFRVYQSAVSGDTLTTILNSNPVYPSLTVYTYDCDAETPAWSPALPDTITSLCALEYTGTGEVKLPSGYTSAAAVTIGEGVVVKCESSATLTNVSGAGIVKFTDDLSSGYALSGNQSAGNYAFANAVINDQGSSSYTVCVTADGDVVKLANSAQNDGRTGYSVNVSAGVLTLTGASETNGSMWYGNGSTLKQTGGTITCTATGTGTSGNGNGLLLGWSSAATLNISGGSFLVENSSLNFWTAESIVNISGTADVKVKGVFKGAGGKGVVLSGGTFELGSIGYQGVPLTLNGGTLKAYESTTISSATTIGGAVTICVDYDTENEVPYELKFTGAMTGDSTVTKTGKGTLNLGSNRPVVGEVEGTLKFVATSDEIVAKEITLKTSTGLTLTEAQILAISDVVDESGEAVEIASATYDSDEGEITLTLKSEMPTITVSSEIKNIAGLTFPDAGGELIIQGSTGDADPLEVTFDGELPANVTVKVTGNVAFKLGGTVAELPTSVMTFSTGAVIDIASSCTLTVPAGVTANVSGDVSITLTNQGTFNVVSGKCTMTAPDAQSVVGTVTVEKDATLVAKTKDSVSYASSASYVINVKGTLQMDTRWTMSGNLNLYGGCTLTGTGDSDAWIDIFSGGRVTVYKGDDDDDETTITVPGNIRMRSLTETVFVAAGMTLAVTNLYTVEAATVTKTGAGTVSVYGNQSFANLTISAGTWEFATGEGDDERTLTVNTAIIGTPKISGTGTLNLNGATINAGTLSAAATNRYSIDGVSTLTIACEYNETGDDGSGSIMADDTKDDPFIAINSGATLNLNFANFSGWNGSLTGGYIKNSGSLLVTTTGSGFFRNHLVLTDGCTTILSNLTSSVILYGGTATADTAQIMLDSGSATITAASDEIKGFSLDNDYNGGGFGTKGAGITVGKDATLTIEPIVKGAYALAKWGEGTLVLNNSSNTYSGTMELNAGTIKSVANVTVIKGSAASGYTLTSWTETVGEGEEAVTYNCYGLKKQFIIRIR